MLMHAALADFEATSHRDGARAVVRFSGELDLASEGLARVEAEIALDRGGDELLVDLRDLTFLDVRGAHLLLDLSAMCRERGRRLLIAPAPPRVLRVLDLCGDRSRFDFVELRERRPLVA